MTKVHLVALLLFALRGIAQAQPQDTAVGCIPLSERAGRPFGCFIIASQPIGIIAPGDAYWHLETFPTRAAAEKQKGERGVVYEVFDKVWLLTMGPAATRTSGGQHVAAIGPLPIATGRPYTAQFMEATFQPGMKSRVHRHGGPEAWYTLSGEVCLETPAGSMVGSAGGREVIVPGGPPMELTATGKEVRRSLVLILHDSEQPHTTLAPDWKPKGLCKI
jgi:quercetin dioxygenase-like cupin family protein